MTVNAESYLEIEELVMAQRKNRRSQPVAWSANDCFRFEFEEIDDYDGYVDYSPVLETFDCSGFSHQVECQYLDKREFEIKFLEDGEYGSGTIGPFKNPPSVVSLEIRNANYYRGCTGNLAYSIDRSKGFSNFQKVDLPISNIVFTTDNQGQKIVGDDSAQNTATFVITPSTDVILNGGFIIIDAPEYLPEEYAFFGVSECVSDRFLEEPDQTDGLNDDDKSFWEIEYYYLSGGASDSLTLECPGWVNPIVPKVTEGFRITFKDAAENAIMQSDYFSLDASAYTPMPIPFTDIFTTLSVAEVKASTNINFAFDTPIQIVSDCDFDGGDCGAYVKITFPKEIEVPGALTVSTADGGFMLLTEDGDQPEIVSYDFSDRLDQWIVVKGGTDPYFDQNTRIDLTFDTIINSFFGRDSSFMKIQIFKDEALTMELMSIEDYYLSASNNVPNPLVMSETDLSSDDLTVQAASVLTITASTTTPIVGKDSFEELVAAIHISFPSAFEMPSDGLQGSDIQLEINGQVPDDYSGAILDTLITYNERCLQYVCYLLEFSTATTIDEGAEIVITINGQLKNPVSIYPIDSIIMTTASKYEDDDQYYAIDQIEVTPIFESEFGDIDESTMSISVAEDQDKTYLSNVEFTYTFTLQREIPQNGFIKINFGQGFTISAVSSAVSKFQIMSNDDPDMAGRTYASAYNVVDRDYVDDDGNIQEVGVTGIVTTPMPPGTYEATLAGIRNPRFLITNAASDQSKWFKISTYDFRLPLSDDVNLIDKGKGGYLNINLLQSIAQFSIQPENYTNSAEAGLIVTWYTSIETANEDRLWIKFPENLIEFIPETANDDGELDCEPFEGSTTIIDIQCKFDGPELEIILKEVNEPTGLFKVRVNNIRGPPSLRINNPVERIYTSTSIKSEEISEWTNEVLFQTEIASEILDLDGDINVVNDPKGYSAESLYTIKFNPTSVSQQYPVSIYLQYPSTVTPTIDMYTTGCTVYLTHDNGDRYPSRDVMPDGTCTTDVNDQGRTFEMLNVLPIGYGNEVQMEIGLYNPVDNWGSVGFKIRTFETVLNANPPNLDEPLSFYMVDKHEGNELIPSLECDTPCNTCESDEDDGELGRSYCTSCWLGRPQKYLNIFSAWNDIDKIGEATCASECRDGYTTDGTTIDPLTGVAGDSLTYVCTECAVECATCEDEGLVGDKDKCLTCSDEYPFIYSIDQTCLVDCESSPLGLYSVQVSGDTQKTCDKCNEVCERCAYNQVNCTRCAVESPTPALFYLETEEMVAGRLTQFTRGQCLEACPLGFYTDTSNPISHECKACSSPCATCVDSPTKCMSCDGTEGRNFVFLDENTCHVECPDGTASDMANQKCFKCAENCQKCTSPDSDSCIQCYPPLLLEDGLCKESCENPGYFPNKAGTICINQIEFPLLGPIFTIASLVILVIVLIIKIIKKDTQLLPSLIAMISVMEWFAIIFVMVTANIYSQDRILQLGIASFFFLYLLNAYNYYYVVNCVQNQYAEIEVKLKRSKIEQLKKDFHKWKRRREKFEEYLQKQAKKKEKASQKWKFAARLGSGESEQDVNAPLIAQHSEEGGQIEMVRLSSKVKKVAPSPQKRKPFDLDNLSDPGDSLSQREGGESDSSDVELNSCNESECFSGSEDDEQYDGGLNDQNIDPKKFQEFLKAKAMKNIEERKTIGGESAYYQKKLIGDKGFKRWMETYPRVYNIIKWVGLLITFKMYRMTYSYFLRQKQFLVIYQKKKFKKFIISTTMIGMILVELPNVIGAVLGMSSLQFNQQVAWSVVDAFMISCILICLSLCEIAIIDKIMRTQNTQGQQMKKAAAACESTTDSDDDVLSDEESDDYPDWRLTLKDIVGNPKLFAMDQSQARINKFEYKWDPRIANSHREFETGVEPEEDERQVKSFPNSPREYEAFEGMAHGNWGSNFDNVYAESKMAGDTKGIEYSEAGTQAGLLDINTALARKGAGTDILTPGVDRDDYSRRKQTKKKRGRKNKYYRQIDAEDDQEADQMSDGSDSDALDGIKEAEDEEDEDEKIRLAKLKAEKEAKAKAERDRKEAEELEWKRKEEEARRIVQEEQDRKAKEEAERKAKEDAEIAMLLAKKDEQERIQKEKQAKEMADRLDKSDVQSELSLMMAQSNQMQKFGGGGVEVPPRPESRRFNECDIVGNLNRDERGNVTPIEDQKSGGFKDKDGNPTNQRGYLIDEKSGDVVNNADGQKMFAKKELDEKGEIPAPFSIEKHNFNPHDVRGDFDFDRNNKPVVREDPKNPGSFADRKGAKVSSRGYRVDSKGNMIDNHGRKKFDRAQMTPDGDLPKLFNYNGRRFDVTDVIGQMDKDQNGNMLPLTDQNGQLVDNLNRPINSKGYLIDERGNIIDKEGKVIFLKEHLKDDEFPKILPFTKFNIKNVLGDFEMDPLGQPILDRDANGNFIDRQGRRVNSKGYLVDKHGNVINQNGRVVFEKNLLDSEEDIPKVFRTGLLKSDTASSLSRLMSEIGREPPSGDEAAAHTREMERMSGGTSDGGDMGITPADYNAQNMMPGGRGDMDMDESEDDEDGEGDEEMSEGSQAFGQMVGGHGDQYGPGVQFALKKRRRKKKKKKKVAMEDPSLREHLLAGAYGGVAKPKPKRTGVKYTTDLTAGLRDIATPGNYMRDPSMKKMMTSFSGKMDMVGHGAESSRGRRGRHTGRMRSSLGGSDAGSAIGSKIGSKISRRRTKQEESTSRLLNPQQREAELKQKHLDAIQKKKMARKAKGGKVSKDADFEKMFGKDIDEFLEDSEFDIDSIDKMSQFSKRSKNTIRSAEQAGRLRGLEKLYLQRLEGSGTNQEAVPRPKAKGNASKFRGTGDPSTEGRGKSIGGRGQSEDRV